MTGSSKVALVTGAGGGFGEAIAKTLAASAAIVVVDRKGQEAERVAAGIRADGGAAIAIQADVSDAAGVAQAAERTRAEFGSLDILVNNAGIIHRMRPMAEVDEAEFDRLFAVNVKSIYLSVRHLVPLFRDGGSIVNIASTGGLRPRPGLAWYNATKGAVITLSKSMALELAPRRIRVNVVAPAMGETGMLADLLPSDGADAMAGSIVGSIPLGRFCAPADVANAVAFLTGDGADFITGTCLEVDGGRCV